MTAANYEKTNQCSGYQVKMARILLERRRAKWFTVVENRLGYVFLNDLADEYAIVPGSLAKDEARRAEMFANLHASIVKGEFGPLSKPFLAYMPVRSPTDSPTFIETYPPGRYRLRPSAVQIWTIGSGIIANLWVPLPLALAWCERRQIAPPLSWAKGAPAAEKIKRAEGRPLDTVAPMLAELDTAPGQRRKPTQNEVNNWIITLYHRAHASGDLPPKAELEAFPACSKAIGATNRQMKQAMKGVPKELKRKRGARDH